MLRLRVLLPDGGKYPVRKGEIEILEEVKSRELLTLRGLSTSKYRDCVYLATVGLLDVQCGGLNLNHYSELALKSWEMFQDLRYQWKKMLSKAQRTRLLRKIMLEGETRVEESVLSDYPSWRWGDHDHNGPYITFTYEDYRVGFVADKTVKEPVMLIWYNIQIPESARGVCEIVYPDQGPHRVTKMFDIFAVEECIAKRWDEIGPKVLAVTM